MSEHVGSDERLEELGLPTELGTTGQVLKVNATASGTEWGAAAAGGTPEGTDVLSTGAANGEVLTANGAGASTWEAAAGGGNVSNTGTPVDGQIAVFTNATTIEGDTALSFDTTADRLDIAASGSVAFNGTDILTDAAGLTTLANIDGIDATTKATIEGLSAIVANTAKVGVTTEISTLIEDGTPTLGGNLATNGNELTGATITLHSAGNVVAELGDAVGTNKLAINDSASVEVAAIDSDGNITTAGTVDGIDIATDVGANTTHRTSDGSDHTFIDQSVVSGASPTFDATNITGLPIGSLPFGSAGEQLTTNEAGTALELGLASRYVPCRKDSPGTISIGEPVCLIGWNASGYATVELSSSASASTMPAIGLTKDSFTNSTTGRIQISGNLTGLDTSPTGETWTEGDSIYIGQSPLAGGITNLTNVKPTGSDPIQKIGIVSRGNGTIGSILIQGAGRSNDIPNFTAADKYWYGGTGGVATEGDITAAGRALLDDAAAVNQRATLGLTIGSDVQAHSAVLDATTASFLTADETKLDGIETAADVTDAVNVAAAGAPIITSGAGAPGSTPAAVGDVYVDTTAEVAYVAAGTGSSADWKQATGAGGGSMSSFTVAGDSGGGQTITDTNQLTIAGGTGITTADSVTDTVTINHDAHTGDVTGSTALTIAADSVTFDKMQDTSGTDVILGRSTAGAGTVEEITCTSAGRALLDDASSSAQLATLQAKAIQAYHTLYIDAGAMLAPTTAPAVSDTHEFTTNDLDFDYFAFSNDADDYAQFKVVMPDEWDLGTVKAKFFWTSATGTTTNDSITWGIQAVAIRNDDAIDAAWGTAQIKEDAVLANNGTDMQVSGATPSLTVGGTPALGAMTAFRVYRDVSADTIPEDIWLFGVQIQFRTLTTEPAAW